MKYNLSLSVMIYLFIVVQFFLFKYLYYYNGPVLYLYVVGDAFVTEGSTNVKFPRELIVPGYTGSLVILGTGTFFYHFSMKVNFAVHRLCPCP